MGHVLVNIMVALKGETGVKLYMFNLVSMDKPGLEVRKLI